MQAYKRHNAESIQVHWYILVTNKIHEVKNNAVNVSEPCKRVSFPHLSWPYGALDKLDSPVQW
jgi:hypothetical protein